ncbi:hypothetical protein ACQP04_09900 [Pseudonocardia halophobica]|uniref:hypothetical protein n=1 Tax=Pseudonocardia halophobica TaxID=29401 RepID=UPI003D8AE6E8
MSTDVTGGGTRPGPATRTTSDQQPTDPGQRIRETRRASVVARSVAFPPVPGGRRRHLHIVSRCPFDCGNAHHHLGPAEGGPRRAGCDRGSYIVTPWTVRGERS